MNSKSFNRVLGTIVLAISIILLFVYQFKSSVQDGQYVSSRQEVAQESEAGLYHPITGENKFIRYVPSKQEVVQESEVGLVNPIVRENEATGCCTSTLAFTLEELCRQENPISLDTVVTPLLCHYICAVHVLFARSLDITSFVFLMLDSWKLDPSV